MEGLEPPHLAASDPKSDVSNNFTTSGLHLNSDVSPPESYRDSPHPDYMLRCLKRVANVGHFAEKNGLPTHDMMRIFEMK